MINDRQLPPGDRAGAPTPPPLPAPIVMTSELYLELAAIGDVLGAAQGDLDALNDALKLNEPDQARAAAVKLLAALKRDPRMLALRIARTLNGGAS